MPQDLIAAPSTSLASLPQALVPTLFANAGEDVARRYIEFFAAEHRNANTRAASIYGTSTMKLRVEHGWCPSRRIEKPLLSPIKSQSSRLNTAREISTRAWLL